MRLRSEQESVARVAFSEGRHVVRDHPLQIVLGIGARDANERARAACNAR
jgi:hypothetical protein